MRLSGPATRGCLFTLAAGAALGLAACNDADGRHGRPNAGICTPFPGQAQNGQTQNGAMPAPNATPAADAAGAVDDCLHRWAYTLAGSTDSADEVAQATVAACASSLSRWNQQGLATNPGGPADAASAPSLVTGQPTNPIAEHYAFAQGRALFYVVQGRAGKCAPPAAATGQPAR